jgi:hypothetical protein
MRFRFHEGPRSAEQQQVSTAIDAWWAAFRANAASIDAMFKGRAEFDLPAFMQEHLDRVDERVMWEFGPALRGGKHRLIFTPERVRHLRPLVDELLRRSPNDLGYEFYFGRQPESLELVAATVEGRTAQDIAGWRVAVRINERMGLEVRVVPRREQLTDESILGAASVAVEGVLGEPFLDEFCDSIEVSSEEARGVPFEALADTVRAAVEQSQQTLANAPLVEFGDTLKWTMFKLEPRAADDYPHQVDLFVGKTVHVPMWRCAHTAGFSSRRFSRVGETFCFLKLDGKDAALEGFADKSEIEDALTAVLTPASLGAVIGGGTGLRYSYIDLALTDVERAVPVIRERLQRGRLGRRCWLQFYDDALAAEWVGLWPDSPEPPGLPD